MPLPLSAALAAAVLAAFGVVAVAQPAVPLDRVRAAQRAGDRLQELMRDAEALAARQSKLILELRALENDRRARTAEVARLEGEIAATQQTLTESTLRAEALRLTAASERPDVEARLVQLYKLGWAGSWRLLLDVEDLRSIGRKYRNAAALTQINHDRARAHQRTLNALAREQEELEARATQLARLQQDAVRAQREVERTVAARVALVDAIDADRDLNAQMTGELQAAQQRMQVSLKALDGASTDPVTLPLRPFRGVLPWPARGAILTRFGRQAGSRSGADVVRNGVELALPEDHPIAAIHEGTVAFAGQFTGYGTLVILDHGDNAFSLYGHLGSLRVARFDRVASGAPLGASGRDPSGNPALYFELRVDGRPVDPLQWLQRTQ